MHIHSATTVTAWEVFPTHKGGIDLNVFEAVKQSVTTRQAAEHYGIHVGRNGIHVSLVGMKSEENPPTNLDID